jgi:hypothetical protein
VYRFDVTDQVTGAFLLTSVGHTFEPIQCVDANGLPVPGPCDLTSRTFGACVAAGCHGDQTAARNAFVNARSTMNFYTDLLWTDTDADAIMESTDAGVLPQVLAQAIAAGDSNEINLYDGTFTPAEGGSERAAGVHARADDLVELKVAVSCARPHPVRTPRFRTRTHKSSGEGAQSLLLEVLRSRRSAI